jgi:hypothetical protein
VVPVIVFAVDAVPVPDLFRVPVFGDRKGEVEIVIPLFDCDGVSTVKRFSGEFI